MPYAKQDVAGNSQDTEFLKGEVRTLYFKFNILQYAIFGIFFGLGVVASWLKLLTVLSLFLCLGVKQFSFYSSSYILENNTLVHIVNRLFFYLGFF